MNGLPKTAPGAVGLKQTLRAIQSGRAQMVYLAKDANQTMREEVLAKAKQADIPVCEADSMKALGEACNIQVPAAAAAQVGESN